MPNPLMPQTGRNVLWGLPTFPGGNAPKSLCGQYREVIAAMLDQGHLQLA